MSPSLLFGYAEAAERLGLSRRYLELLVSQCRIPHRRIGRRVLFSQDDLLAIIDAAAQLPDGGERHARAHA